ncbi:hypothetical protein EK21DRAFT_118419 [Setomelanomma holmii]|uniref:Uncharacterized protein n=1 Tax=Setomelanomma holmii TaxID=210430 RepID=A0A9P4GVQ6_9PLEO|nr:hypothetical protein EK21DRAFT_118419 [Setomelanomma holmii]
MPKLSKANVSKALSKKIMDMSFTAHGNGIYFQDMDAAINSTGCVLFNSPTPDLTIPITTTEYHAIVKRIVAAIKNMATALDRENSAYKARLTPGNDKTYSDWMIERCAWNILIAVKAIHTTGFTAPIYDTTTLEHIGQTCAWTFDERISVICRLLEISKSNVLTLMKNEKTDTIIGAPHRLYDSAISNNKANSRRAPQLVEGRELAKERERQAMEAAATNAVGDTELVEADGDESEIAEQMDIVTTSESDEVVDEVVSSTGLDAVAARILTGRL